VSDMLNCLGWKTLQSHRAIARLCLFHKFSNNLAYVDNAELNPVAYSSRRSSGRAFKLPIIKCDFYVFLLSKILTGVEQTAQTSSIV